MLNIVVLNGGRGAASIIPAMLRHQGLNVTSIVNAYDDGKSTGEIRRFFDMLGPSDIRKVQELMLPEEDPQHEASRALFAFRYEVGADREAILAEMRAFADGGSSVAGIALTSRTVAAAVRTFVREFLDGLAVIEKARGARFEFGDCSLMNCLYAGAYLACRRDMELTTKTMDRLFRLKGTVLPNSVENKWLMALRQNGEVLYSEAEIVELRSNVLIDAVYLLDRPLDRTRFAALTLEQQRYFLSRHHAGAAASPGVRLALEQADVIVFSAGTQHSSLYPTYMSRGIAETIARNREALKVFVTNIGADYETPSYRASDYVRGAYKYLRLAEGRQYAMPELFSAILINNGRRKADETYVDYDEENFAEIPVRRIVDDFESAASPGKHDGARVIDTILSLYNETAGAP
ncbi:MAG: YvcK family protein [Alphaproteobacteria bacterium]|nr:YvcK family protein [Alphaproteobacteria bacterium]MBV9372943.1 YvcK family protein [Alphaproteobacteria bacterium]MBV9900938.1 YvcK family protein [Alphaproteobacteria bacterium]